MSDPRDPALGAASAEPDHARHVYDYAFDPDGDTAAARVCRMVGHDKRVLEIGAGPGVITRRLSAQNNRTTALELDPTALPLLAPHCDRVVPADLNRSDWPALLGASRFDAIVAADVLEHLTDPWATLARMKSLLAPGGAMVVSLPHAAHACILGCLLAGDVHYNDWGLLDRTHIRFFGVHNVQALFADAGLKVVRGEFVVHRPEETEFAAMWRALPVGTRRFLERQRFAHVYQVVVTAAPRDDARPEVELARLDPRQFESRSLGRWLRRLLDVRARRNAP